MPLKPSGPPADLAAPRSEALEQAQEAAMSFLHAGADMADEVELIASATSEFDAGWVFNYQSARFLRTGAFEDILAATRRCLLRAMERTDAWPAITDLSKFPLTPIFVAAIQTRVRTPKLR